MTKLQEGIDFYMNSEGLMVFTKHYHLKRGYCCKSGCEHCPYGALDPNTPQELKDPWHSENSDGPEVYDFDIPEDQEL